MNQITSNHVVLTLAEAARFLRVKKAVLQKLVEQGRVPARKIGDEWRFFRGALETWLSGKSDSRLAFLEQAGAFKDDTTLMPMLEEIYKARGRPMVEDGDLK
jgi:excisionase family DNA binding protein